MEPQEDEVVVKPPSREALRLAYDFIVANILPRLLAEQKEPIRDTGKPDESR
jgi:hypothetical protein